jgi:ABC-type uncharacterized transport system ATPase subunit
MDANLPLRLELIGITKRFPGVLANDHVGFAVRPGEIHALLGENGAGKSTLVKMIYGVMQPDAGEIRWNGEPVTIANPKAARRLGIGMVFQHFSLFDAMTVLENIALGHGRENRRGSSKPRSARRDDQLWAAARAAPRSSRRCRSASASASRSCAACCSIPSY